MSDALMSDVPLTGLRARLDRFISSKVAQNSILVLILINAITLGLETSESVMSSFGAAITLLDKAILVVFLIEIALRLYIHRLSFFKDPWNIFDFVVVGIALVPASGPFSVLRALRVLRVLRVLTIVPSMRRVVGALLGAVPGLISIAMVLFIFYYVAAVIATKLFGPDFPDWFGGIGRSLYTLFQVMTLESWSMGISRPVMEKFPYAWIFFVPFILIATFTMLNLFIAVIVGAMQTVAEQEHKEVTEALGLATEHIEADMHSEMRALRSELQSMRLLLEQNLPQKPGADLP